MLGSELVIRALARRGVTTIFSLSGNQIMPLYDACIDADIRIVHVRHEAAAVFMADAWAQVTGEIGVAMLTAGPGISNGIAPLYSALQAESPVLLLSGDSPLAEDGMGSFQELDQTAMSRPLTKLSRRVTAAEDMVPSVEEALAMAMAPRRGPVHLAFPFDLLKAETRIDALPPLHQPAPLAPSDTDIAALAALLAGAQRPVLLAGPSACRRATQGLWRALGERLQLPVVFMESPRGLRDPSLGAIADPLAQADLVVLAGKRLDFTLNFGRAGAFGADAKIVVVDADAAMLTRARALLGNRLVAAVPCDPALFFDRMPNGRADAAARGDWVRLLRDAVQVRTTAAPAAAATALHPRALCEAVQRFLAEAHDPILVCDGGEFGQWAQAFCDAPVRIVNGMSGAIGGGICYAIAAKIARPDATVVALMGDGTSGFHFMEFDTAVRENAPFIAVIGNDLRWNAEHVIQLRTYGADRLIGCSLAESARYHAVAEAVGGFGAEADDVAQLQSALHAAAASRRPACINVAIDGLPAPTFDNGPASRSTH